VTQFIPILVWKQIYIDYQLHHIDLIFVEDTLKDCFCDTLKELKIRISNEEGLERATLQCDEVLKHLSAMDGHVTKNVLKRCQSLLDGQLVSIVMGMKMTKSIGFLKPREGQEKV
jgi:acetyl/propionyl-CoA carboxylase alpha subunit